MPQKTRLQPLFLGTDHAYVFAILTDDQSAAIDISSYALSFRIKRYLSDADNAALVTKTTGNGITIAGTFNSAPTMNAQRATVTIADTDTDAIAEGVAHWELKRTDDGAETVYAYGTVPLTRGVHRT